MAEFTIVPSYSSKVDLVAQVSETRFGDGYSQRSPANLVNVPATYQLFFKADSTEVAEVDSFLRARAGVEAFDWTPPVYPGVPSVFICKEWGWTYSEFDNYGIRAVFNEVFEEA